MARVVVDTNIFFSALMSAESSFTKTMLRLENEFFVCETTLVKIFNHKEKLIRASHLTSDDMARLYHILVKRVQIYKEDLIGPENWKTAYEMCHDVDETDTPHVALVLELNAVLWTGDKRLKEGLKDKGFKDFFVPKISR
jgi:predicted nucleic acid-binding protein